jgi:hypothetical protein
MFSIVYEWFLDLFIHTCTSSAYANPVHRLLKLKIKSESIYKVAKELKEMATQ